MKTLTPVVAAATAGAAVAVVSAGLLLATGSSLAAALPLATADTLSPDPVADQSEWTQWRGAARDGVVSAEARAGEWPERPVLLWEQEVGEGYSGPVIAGDRVWVHTRRGEAEVVSSLTLGEGRTVWRRRYEVPFQQDPDARAHGLGPYATPAVADGRLFTLGVTSVLSVWDARSGGLLWRRDYAEEFERNHAYFGTASSPLIWGDLCFVHFGGTWGEESDLGAMVALDVATGAERWRWDGDAPSVGASPVLAEISDRLQLVFKSKMNIVGVDPESGAELWRIPYKVSQDNTIVTPLFIGDQLVTSDWDMGMHSWRIEEEAGTWSARKLWQTRAASIFTSSPVVVGGEIGREIDARDRGQAGGEVSGRDGGQGGGQAGGQIVGFSHFRRGQLFGMDPVDGEVLWLGDGRSGEHATLVAWGNELLVFQEDGSLVVGQVSREGFRPLRTYSLGRSMMWAHPAVVDNRIIIKDGSRLAVYSFE